MSDQRRRLEEWRKRSAKKYQEKRRRRALLGRLARIPAVNPERLAKLRAKQFGTDGKREWILEGRCFVTGSHGTDFLPIDPAHIGRTRGAGADSTHLLPLRRDVHNDYDSLPREKFEARWPVTHAELLDEAKRRHAVWLILKEAGDV